MPGYKVCDASCPFRTVRPYLTHFTGEIWRPLPPLNSPLAIFAPPWRTFLSFRLSTLHCICISTAPNHRQTSNFFHSFPLHHQSIQPKSHHPPFPSTSASITGPQPPLAHTLSVAFLYSLPVLRVIIHTPPRIQPLQQGQSLHCHYRSSSFHLFSYSLSSGFKLVRTNSLGFCQGCHDGCGVACGAHFWVRGWLG